jgi:DNA (cytosine-5)-methyltransferase 1
MSRKPRVYYNENNKYCAQWLRNLMAGGYIPDGDIDERSIEEVKESDVQGYVQCHFFAGIGGWAYAGRLAGWPDDCPVWTGSPPCQDNSVAGAIWNVRAGLRGHRSGLAHIWIDLMERVRPPVVFFENVPGIKKWISEIERRMEGIGYSVSRKDIASWDIGALDKRERVWIVADINGKRLSLTRPSRPLSFTGQPWRTITRNLWREPNNTNGRIRYGVPSRVECLRAYGNAINPHVAAEIIRNML